MDIFQQALFTATFAHKDQRRKWSDESYIVHPIAVAETVSWVENDQKVLAAALLHDVVEDTDMTLGTIQSLFGIRVAELVRQVTKVSTPEDGNRAQRRQKDLYHYTSGTSDAQTIKLADIICNSQGLEKIPKSFLEVYIPEQIRLSEALILGNPKLRSLALKTLTDNWIRINSNRSMK